MPSAGVTNQSGSCKADHQSTAALPKSSSIVDQDDENGKNSKIETSSLQECNKTSINEVQAPRCVKQWCSVLFSEVRDNSGQNVSSTRPWQSSFLRLGPLSGVLATVLALVSLVVSLAILVGSEGTPIRSWSAPPSTYLAICTAVANQSMRYAMFHGIVIAWWYKAGQGSTIERLHYDWRCTTFHGAISSGRHMGLIGLACIFSTLVVVDGPLLQRASTVVLAPVTNQHVVLNTTMVPQIPTDFSGAWLKYPDNSNIWAQMFNETIPTWNGSIPNDIASIAFGPASSSIVAPWFARHKLSGFIQGCPGVCKAKIKAPALAKTHCTSFSEPVNYSDTISIAEIRRWAHEIAPPLATFSLVVQPNLALEGQESIDLVTGSATVTGHHCVGTFEYSACTLQAAIGEYDVIIDHHSGDTIDLGPEPPRIVALQNNMRVNRKFDEALGGFPSTLGGIVRNAEAKWATLAMTFSMKDTGVQSDAIGGAYEQFTSYTPGAKCMSYRDPFDDVVGDINELMIRFGAAAAKNTASYLKPRMDSAFADDVNSTIIGQIMDRQDVYHADYAFFAAAAVVEIVCILFVLPTYWKWWTLGRPVSLSPIEIAKAFESPLLGDCNSSYSARDIAKAAGEMNVQYGAVATNGGGTKLAFAKAGDVQRPCEGMRPDY